MGKIEGVSVPLKDRKIPSHARKEGIGLGLWCKVKGVPADLLDRPFSNGGVGRLGDELGPEADPKDRKFFPQRGADETILL